MGVIKTVFDGVCSIIRIVFGGFLMIGLFDVLMILLYAAIKFFLRLWWNMHDQT